MPSRRWFKVIAIVAVVSVVGLLVYRADAHREFIPSEKREQYSQELADGVRLVQRQTVDMQDGFSKTFATLRPQDGIANSRGDASQGQSSIASKVSESGNSDYVSSVEDLRDAWTPRYSKVIEDHSKFLSRVKHARQRAILWQVAMRPGQRLRVRPALRLVSPYDDDNRQ